MHIEAHTNKLDEETRYIYDDDFYLGLDGVLNAVDNIDARLFSDSMCVYYKKPLLESGTLGACANYQVVIPCLTESYGSSRDPPETNIPACTLHNFPSVIDHCCLWARDIFSGFFEQGPDLANNFLKNGEDFLTSLKGQGSALFLENLQLLSNQLIDDRPSCFKDCVRWARLKFEELFHWKIRDLLHMFPLDHITSSGSRFWTGSKRPPNAELFDPKNEIHSSFVTAATLLRARIYGIASEPKEKILNLAAKVSVKEWELSNCVIDTGENENPKSSEIDDNDPRILELLEKLKKLKDGRLLAPEHFEKDDDSNHHMDFVASAANVRALNYRIKTETKLEIKRIAGKIIPAISTTTAMICGFVCLEMYKIHSVVAKPISAFRCGFVNLAISMFSLTEPIPCPKAKFAGKGEKFSPLWDTLELKGDLTVKEFIDGIKAKWGVRVATISAGPVSIYAAYASAQKRKERMPKKITDILREILKKDLEGKKFLRLECICRDDDGGEVSMPPFVLSFRG
jgi:ubiquitin-activating enzyme E1